MNYKGRSYRSQSKLLGIPLVDIQVADPATQIGEQPEPKSAFGWIAIGDRATGLLFAYGSVAKGLIAVGGIAIGAVSLGGLAAGIVSVGGLGLGIVSIGGLGLGVFSISGLAIGWQACGGLAIGWKFAAGGAAVAHEAAFGGFALAKQFAVGGAGGAEHFNDALAKSFTDTQPAKQFLTWLTQHQLLFMVFTGLISVLPGLLQALMYKRRTKTEEMN